MPHHNHICPMHPPKPGGDGSIYNFDWYSSKGPYLVKRNALYLSVVKKITWTLSHQKNAQKVRHDFCCYQFHLRLSLGNYNFLETLKFLFTTYGPLVTFTNCSIGGSTSHFLARSCPVRTLFCCITLHNLTQLHKLNSKPAYLKSTDLELSNEVYLVLIEKLELPKDQSVKHAFSML